MTITQITITVGEKIPHPHLNYSSINAEVSVTGVNTDGITNNDIESLHRRASHELDFAIGKLHDRADLIYKDGVKK